MIASQGREVVVVDFPWFDADAVAVALAAVVDHGSAGEFRFVGGRGLSAVKVVESASGVAAGAARRLGRVVDVLRAASGWGFVPRAVTNERFPPNVITYWNGLGWVGLVRARRGLGQPL
nr:hypothetical protein [Rhodococcus sp. 06-1059B-a]